ncbi:MAG: SpoIID/LytB domain-containing protein [Fibrobacterota bacterium]
MIIFSCLILSFFLPSSGFFSEFPAEKTSAPGQDIRDPLFDIISAPIKKKKTCTIRVLLEKTYSKIVLKCQKLGFEIYENDELKWDETVTDEIKIFLSNGRLMIDYPEGSCRAAVSAVIKIIPDQNSHAFFKKKKYRGSFIIKASDDGKNIFLVNRLPLEDYLRGVVPKEIPCRDSTLIEAYKAQAVCARTYALKKILQRTKSLYHVTSGIYDQVYGGKDAETKLADSAVSYTRKLAVHHNDTLINCYYSSTCGGTTADFGETWNKKRIPYLVSINDSSFCSGSSRYNWTLRVSLKNMEKNINKNLSKLTPDFKPGKLQSIKIASRTSSGRVKEMIFSVGNRRYSVFGDKIRWALGGLQKRYPILSSSFITISKKSGNFEITGRGFGHGIGLCQYGAMGMAKKGYDFRDIINHYFRDAVIINSE